MAGNSYSVFNAMVDIVASPGKALDEIRRTAELVPQDVSEEMKSEIQSRLEEYERVAGASSAE